MSYKEVEKIKQTPQNGWLNIEYVFKNAHITVNCVDTLFLEL